MSACLRLRYIGTLKLNRPTSNISQICQINFVRFIILYKVLMGRSNFFLDILTSWVKVICVYLSHSELNWFMTIISRRFLSCPFFMDTLLHLSWLQRILSYSIHVVIHFISECYILHWIQISVMNFWYFPYVNHISVLNSHITNILLFLSIITQEQTLVFRIQ